MSEKKAEPSGEDAGIVITTEHRFKRGNGSEKVIRSDSEELQVKKFDTTPAKVRRGYGFTLNLGNYESARIDVSVEVPCYLEDVYLADEWAQEFVRKRVIDEINSVRKQDENKSSSPL